MLEYSFDHVHVVLDTKLVWDTGAAGLRKMMPSRSVRTAPAPLKHRADQRTSMKPDYIPRLAPHERIVGIDQRVPVLDGSMLRYINLDNAASTPVLREVLDTVNRFMDWYASVHRGTGFKSRVATQAYEDARAIVAEFVGANLCEHVVIFGKNTTEAINKLSYRLPLVPDDVVPVSQLEHHSNDLPWRARAHVEHIGVDASVAWTRLISIACSKRMRGESSLLPSPAAPTSLVTCVIFTAWQRRRMRPARKY